MDFRYLKSFKYLCVTLILIVGFFWIKPVSGATTYLVTKTEDSNDGSCDADCSLREAVVAANANPGDNVINLPAGSYTLTLSGRDEESSATGDLDITSNLSIVGTNPRTTLIDAGSIDRVLDLGSGINFSLSGVTIANGNLLMSGSGGGIRIKSGSIVTITNVTVMNSTAGLGSSGGIHNDNGNVTIINSTISGNSAVSTGGGIWNSGNMTISNSTISGNMADSYGGGIYNSGTISLNNVTVAKNSTYYEFAGAGVGNDGASAILNLKNSILADNHSYGWDSANDCAQAMSSPGTIHSQGYNLIEANKCTITGTTSGNLIDVSANLDPLQNNGGPTDTHALPTDNPAIDSGNPATPGSGGDACINVDQRNITRPQGSRCDIGAFEHVNHQKPESISISGSKLVETNEIYRLTANVLPHNTTLPITYTWSTADQFLITRTSGISDTINLVKEDPGVVAVTVSASNAEGSVSAVHEITVVEGVLDDVSPDVENTLVYSDPHGWATTVQIPEDAVDVPTVLAYKSVLSATAPTGFEFADHAFNLDVYQESQLQHGFTFMKPISIRIDYSEENVAGLDENNLKLFLSNDDTWVDVADSCIPASVYDRHQAENWLKINVCHLSRFALFGKQQHNIYMPSIIKAGVSPK